MLYLVFNPESLVSVLSTFATNLLYTVFLTTSFVTTLFNLLTSSGRGFNLSILIYLLQFLSKLNLFIMQNLKYQRVKYF